VAWVEGSYLRTKWHLDPSNRLEYTNVSDRTDRIGLNNGPIA